MDYHTHTVKKGQHLTGIAKSYGFKGSDWRKLYNHPENASLRKKRKDPNVILAGDKVKVPAVSLKDLKAHHKQLVELYKNVAAAEAPVKETFAMIAQVQGDAERLQKAGISSEKQVKELLKAKERARKAWKNAEKWQSLCKLGGKNDPSFAGSIICIPEGNRVFETMRSYLDAQEAHFKGVKKAKLDQKKLDAALLQLKAARKKGEMYLREWQKTHEYMLNEISVDIRRAELSMPFTF